MEVLCKTNVFCLRIRLPTSAQLRLEMKWDARCGSAAVPVGNVGSARIQEKVPGQSTCCLSKMVRSYR